jgi:hypothetical protein
MNKLFAACTLILLSVALSGATGDCISLVPDGGGDGGVPYAPKIIHRGQGPVCDWAQNCNYQLTATIFHNRLDGNYDAAVIVFEDTITHTSTSWKCRYAPHAVGNTVILRQWLCTDGASIKQSFGSNEMTVHIPTSGGRHVDVLYRLDDKWYGDCPDPSGPCVVEHCTTRTYGPRDVKHGGWMDAECSWVPGA